MKAKIIKFFIKKNNFFDRERLACLSEKPLYKLFTCWLYRKWLKAFKQKKLKTKLRINNLERISNCYSKIGFKSKLKAFLTPRKRFKNVKIITNIIL